MMENIIYWIGLIVGSLLLIYVVFGLIYMVLKPNVDPKDCKISMPALRPVPIPTRNQPSPIHKLTVFIFEVRKWEVVEDWRYTYKSDDNVELFIPKGFVFDGASIPRPFWAILNPIGLLLIPGLLHDYAYKYDQLWQVKSNGKITPYEKKAGKDYWDILFTDIGKEVNGFFLINAIAWAAVSFGGSGAWNKHREAGLTAEKP